MPAYKSRFKKLFDPKSDEPFKVSRSKIDNFIECPRCFYLDRRLGVSRPSMPGFTLNIAVDHLLKKEFDIHRADSTPHPLMENYDIDAIPFDHPNMGKWRENFVGVQSLHEPTNLLVFGAVDDIWVNPKEELIVVDYKATSKKDKPTLDGRWGMQYKRQMDVYQWLVRQNGFKVSDTGYFVYVNGKKDNEAFDGKLEFDIDVISYVGNTDWIEKTLLKIKEVLMDDRVPSKGELCEHCPYREEAGKALLENQKKKVVSKEKREVKETNTLF
jgi:CRISPR/Cas system-associated exonuclease Cas4 (RecB family)